MKSLFSTFIVFLILSVTAQAAGRRSAVSLHFANPTAVDEVVNGQLGPGALYRLVRPANWNGSLVLYAHGFVPKSEPVAFAAEGNLIISLLAPQGFAVALSSFSENGWAVKDGAQILARGKIRREDFQRYSSSKLCVLGEIYLAHAAFTE